MNATQVNSISSIDALAASVQASQEENRKEREQFLKDALSYYFLLVSRADNPEPGDDRELLWAMQDLRLSVDEMRADHATMTEGRRLLALHAEKDDSRQAFADLYAEKASLEKRHEAEIEDIKRRLAVADDRRTAAGMARDRLFRLAETRPEMFDMNCDPPAFVAFQVEQRPEKPAIKSKK